jgi:CDP-glucose 4,6-dehydratase
MRAWSTGEKAVIRNPSHVRPWQHVLEPLSGYLLLGEKLYHADHRVVGEAFNFGPMPERSQTVATLVETMSSFWTTAKWAPAAQRAEPKAEAAFLRLNCDKALQRLEWLPALSFAESVRFTMEWYRNFYDKHPHMAKLTETQILAYHELAKTQGQPWAV